MTVAQGTPRTEEALAKVIAYNERINAQSKLPGGVMINPADYPPDGWATARELERENAALSAQNLELQKEIEGWKRYKQNIDEALNTGDGSYRP